jgi:hypothetical protein
MANRWRNTLGGCILFVRVGGSCGGDSVALGIGDGCIIGCCAVT